MESAVVVAWDEGGVELEGGLVELEPVLVDLGHELLSEILEMLIALVKATLQDGQENALVHGLISQALISKVDVSTYCSLDRLVISQLSNQLILVFKVKFGHRLEERYNHVLE